MEVTIRVYDPRDAADLADIFFRSVRQVALSDYTAAQVRAWAPEPRTAEWAHGEASDGRLVLVAANADDRPVAYIDLEPNGHIDRVFCAPEAAGQGIASRLYDAVEAAAREQGIRSLVHRGQQTRPASVRAQRLRDCGTTEPTQQFLRRGPDSNPSTNARAFRLGSTRANRPATRPTSSSKSATRQSLPQRDPRHDPASGTPGES